MHLYNTLTHKKEAFTPQDLSCVSLYVCGPTVYDTAHLGNARPYVIFDVLYRLLQQKHPRVVYVRNITDIDDKIIERAQENNIPIDALTEKTTIKFQEDMTALGILSPDHEPRATHHIPHMIALIQQLLDKGHAYIAQEHVLFRIQSFPAYGRLSRRSLEDMRAGARVEVAPYKEDPGDFVLWKPSIPDSHSPGWESPWGWGRPGWHIECSAMSQHLLGVPFDIHGGGQDLIFPHHENEIAQSCAAHGVENLAQIWMHNGILTVEGRKMSKSLNNFLTIPAVLKDYPGEVMRWVLLSAHYRQPLDWTITACDQAQRSLDRLYGALRESPAQGDVDYPIDDTFIATLEDDLNTPLAFAHLHDLASQANNEPVPAKKEEILKSLQTCGRFLGFFSWDPQKWLQKTWKSYTLNPEMIEILIQKRSQARAENNYAEADRLRDQILEDGVVLEDSTGQTLWRRR